MKKKSKRSRILELIRFVIDSHSTFYEGVKESLTKTSPIFSIFILILIVHSAISGE